jgi:hypothetical protein
MAGYRTKKGRPSRPQGRRDRMAAKLAAAPTAWQQFAVSVDWFRMSLMNGVDTEAEVLARVRERTAQLASDARSADERSIAAKVVKVP